MLWLPVNILSIYKGDSLAYYTTTRNVSLQTKLIPPSWLHPSCRQAEEAVVHLGIKKQIAHVQDNRGELRAHIVNFKIIL